MTPTAPPPPIGLLLSGGLDSSILLGHLVRQGHRVQPFYVRSHLFWEEEELRSVRQYVQALHTPQVEPLVVLELPLLDLYGDHWSVRGQDVPGAASEDGAVYLPGRNALLCLKTALWCQMHGLETLMLGVLAANPFADATPAFFADLEATLSHGPSPAVKLVRPLAGLTKLEVMRLGRGLPLEWTFSCLAPVAGQHCGRCNKCAERATAFRLSGSPDPTDYAAAVEVRP